MPMRLTGTTAVRRSVTPGRIVKGLAHRRDDQAGADDVASDAVRSARIASSRLVAIDGGDMGTGPGET